MHIVSPMRRESKKKRSPARSRILTKIREVGPAYAILLAIRRALPSRLFKLMVVQILEIPTAGSVTPPLVGIGRWWSGAQQSTLTCFGHSPDEIRKRLSRGDRPFLTIDRSELRAYVWFADRSHHDEALQVSFEIASDERWLYDGMVAPGHRGRGIYRQLLAAALADLARNGVRRILLAVEPFNRGSLSVHRAAGARRIETIVALNVLGFGFLRAGGVWRTARLGRDRRPIWRVRPGVTPRAAGDLTG